MGGNGGALERFVANDVIVDGHVIIRKGELYVSTSVNFNPWAPGYAGEDGSIDVDFQALMDERAKKLGWKTPQRVFHLFRQCAFTPDEQPRVPMSAWHGRAAAGKGLYLGKYMLDDDTPPEERVFDRLPQSVQDALIEWGVTVRDKKQDTPQNRAAERARRQRKNNGKITYWPYKFVEYDEKVYSELVRLGCNYPDGRVETDPAKLGRLARWAK